MAHADGYTKSVHIGGASPRETEILAFGLCNARLAKAADTRSRIDALHKTHQLWSLLVRDLATEENKYPEALKNELIDLGFWAMKFCVQAAVQEIPLDPLLAVNSNIAEGLKSQAQSANNTNPPIPSDSFVNVA